MGRAEGNSSAGAIAVVVIAGVLVLALFGCGGLAAMSWLFVARSAPMPTPTVVATNSADPSALTITNDAAGLVVIDGKTYTDDELRSLIATRAATGYSNDVVTFEFTDDLTSERRQSIEEIVVGSVEDSPPNQEN